jgi:hypothetical protein
VPRPCRRVRGTAPASFAVVLRRLLQCSPHAPILGQRCTDLTRRLRRGPHSSTTCSRRPAPPVRPDLIYDRDSEQGRAKNPPDAPFKAQAASKAPPFPEVCHQ